jgi:hypothetical protein
MTTTEQLRAIVDAAHCALGDVPAGCGGEWLRRLAGYLLEARALLVRTEGEHPEEEP